MKRVLALGAAASVISALCVSTAHAQEFPKMVFDATYKAAGPAGDTAMRTISDGKGHLRQETSTHGMKIVSIVDYPAKTSYTIMEAQKLVYKTPLSTQTPPDVHDDASAKKVGAKSLGAKVVAGHPCHGWEYKTSQGTSTVWRGDDTQYLVKSETVTPNGTMTMELTSWNTKAPAADAFKVPDGYTVSSLPGTK